MLLSERGAGNDLADASEHCAAALRHREGYVQAHHLMGNIRASQGKQAEATRWYADAEALAGGTHTAASSAPSAAPPPYRWEGVAVGHVRRLKLPDGTSWAMETLSLRPLAFLVRHFLSDAECEELIALARPKLKQSLTMGNSSAAERTSRSVFVGASEAALLGQLQRRLAALAQLPLETLTASEDLQIVHYGAGDAFGMHHDSSRFLPRNSFPVSPLEEHWPLMRHLPLALSPSRPLALSPSCPLGLMCRFAVAVAVAVAVAWPGYLTAFYYLNTPEGGGETAFPAADGAMSPSEALSLADPVASGAGLVVRPERGAALLWYNHDVDGEIDAYAVHSGCRVLSGDKWGASAHCLPAD